MPKRTPRQPARLSQGDPVTAARSHNTPMLPLPTQRALSRLRAAEYLDISPNTFDRMVKDGLMPAPIAIYGRKVWDVRAIDAAIDILSGLGDSPHAANPWG